MSEAIEIEKCWKKELGPVRGNPKLRVIPTDLRPLNKYKKAKAKGGRTRFGITKEDLGAWLDAQKGRCRICGSKMTTPFVDHCHTTNRLRGLLCGLCNSGLGFFRDNTDFLKNAIAYLERTKTTKNVVEDFAVEQNTEDRRVS